jgi:putative Ig domain-containing protein
MRTIRKITLCSAFLLLIAHFGSALLAAPTTLILNEPATTLPEAKAGAEYSHQFQAEGGRPPLAWRVKEGDLPPEMKMEATGKLHGTPKSARNDPYKFVIEVSDSSQPPQTFSQAFTLTIQPAPLRIVTVQAPGQPSLRIAGAPVLLAPISRINSEPSKEPRAETKAAGSDDSAEKIPAFRVEGRLRSALMDEVFALIKSDEELNKPGEVKNYLCAAEFLEFCSRANRREAPNSRQLDGQNNAAEHTDEISQKQAAIGLLNYILDPNTPTRLARFEARSEGDRRLSKNALKKLLLMLNMPKKYVDNVVVRVELGDVVKTVTTDDDGRYEINLVRNKAGEFYVFSTEADFHLSKRKVVVNGPMKVNLYIEDRPVSMLARAVVGYQQAGAASTDFEQNYFFDLFISQSLPFLQKVNPDFGERWRTWGAIRAVSAPQSGNVAIGDLVRGLATNISGLKANEAARIFDYLGGIEARLPWFSNSSLLPSFDRDTKQKFSLSFIASGGFVTPTNPADGVKTFKISDQFRAEFEKTIGGDALKGKDYVTFAPSDRDRFFRQYYAGIRMQTLFFNVHNVPLQRFPAQLDLQFGVNEYVTAGRVRGGVIRLDGYFPLPYESLRFINLFGTAIIKPVRSQVKNTLILEQVEDQKKFDPKTAVLPVSHFNRDYYRVGVGIDFVSFIGKLF